MKKINKLTKRYIKSLPNGVRILNWIHTHGREDLLINIGYETPTDISSKKKKQNLDLARKFTGVNFSKTHKLEYEHAGRFGYRGEMNDILGIKKIIKHEKNIVFEVVRSYKGRSFASDHSKEYQYITRNNLLDEMNSMLINSRTKHTKERTLNIAANYTGEHFSKDYQQEYCHAKKHDYLAELYNKLGITYIKPVRHTKANVLELVKNYHGTCFCKDHPGEYKHARVNGYLDELNINLKNHDKIN